MLASKIWFKSTFFERQMFSHLLSDAFYAKPRVSGMPLLKFPKVPLKSNFTTASPCGPWIAQEVISHCHRAFPRTLETRQLRPERSFWIFLINFTLWKAFYSCLHVLSHGLKFPSCREDILRFCLLFFSVKQKQCKSFVFVTAKSRRTEDWKNFSKRPRREKEKLNAKAEINNTTRF